MTARFFTGEDVLAKKIIPIATAPISSLILENHPRRRLVGGGDWIRTGRRPSKQSVSYQTRQSAGTESSNPIPSANESPVCGFSARISEIARASGFIRILRGTGETHLRAARAHYAAKVSVGKSGGSIRAGSETRSIPDDPFCHHERKGSDLRD